MVSARTLLLLACLAGARAHCAVQSSTCYIDGGNSRVLPYPSAKPPWDHALTEGGCMQLCHDAGFSLAGVEDGAQCFCGNSTAAAAQAGSGCDMPCSGNATQKCGGRSRVNVLAFHCSGTPNPTPPPPPTPVPTPPPPPTPYHASDLNILYGWARRRLHTPLPIQTLTHPPAPTPAPSPLKLHHVRRHAR
jgi:hypothetical protein